jgi:hypothetical protein
MRFISLMIFISVISTISCSKQESISDNISVENFNKNVCCTSPDSITGACRYLVFTITIDDVQKATTMMHMNNSDYYCDAHSEVLVQPDTKRLKHLLADITVNSEGNWIPVNNICMDDFAGKGLKYAGYRIADYSSGDVIYYYGWIGIEVDFNKQKIAIADRGTNLTLNRPIRTRQSK